MYTQPEAYECLRVPRERFGLMGYSVRDGGWRYTEWRNWTAACAAVWGGAGLAARELYDHRADAGRGAASFDDFENANLAHLPEHAPTVARLARALRTQFEGPTGC